MKLYVSRTVLLSIIRSLFIIHSAMVYVIQVCRQVSSRTRMGHSCEISASGWLNYKETLLSLCFHTLTVCLPAIKHFPVPFLFTHMSVPTIKYSLSEPYKIIINVCFVILMFLL
jgi:hypothetical protein